MKHLRKFSLLVATALIACAAPAYAAPDPLPSWNDTAPRKAIIAFVERVTKPGTPDFVPVPQRIATFDNDGTLWAEQPIYFQFAFAIDRVEALAPLHPDWKGKEPFAAVIDRDMKRVMAAGDEGINQLIAATHSGMTIESFNRIAGEWVRTKQHPTLKRPYARCVYLPMLELMTYLRANGFKTFIVSGGGTEFMRSFAEEIYGVPPEQVVGSNSRMKYQLRGDQPELLRMPEVEFVNDKDGKVIGIQKFIGRRPIAAFGNSDGDLQMLQWTATGPRPRLALLVHHTDAVREWAYDRQSQVGTLDKALDAAQAGHWTVLSMKDDWKTIFPP